MDSSSELGASYYGFVRSTYDALILFEACIAGQIKYVSRRPQERERKHVIQSGRIFIYEENASGIKRWTDGISWSPSRILGNFLIYRQLQKAFGPGEKKRAIKKPKTGRYGTIKTTSRNDNGGSKENLLQKANSVPANGDNYGQASVKRLGTESALIGSLTDTYEFLEEGLVKKTISIIHGGTTHHLVSYYTISDAVNQELIVPSKDPKLTCIHPRASLINSQNFPNTVENVKPMERLVYPRKIHGMSRQNRLPLQITGVPNTSPCNNSDMTTDKIYTISHTRSSTTSASEHGSPVCNSTIRHHTSQVSARGVYSAVQRSEKCQGSDKNELHMMGTPSFNSNCALVRNARTIEGEATIRDSLGLTGFPKMEGKEADLTFRHDQDYLHKASLDIIPAMGSTETQGNLPGLMQADLGVHKAHEQKQHFAIYSNAIGVWRLGNASPGHGHYQNL